MDQGPGPAGGGDQTVVAGRQQIRSSNLGARHVEGVEVFQALIHQGSHAGYDHRGIDGRPRCPQPPAHPGRPDRKRILFILQP